jgi:synaptojanin
MYIHLGTNPRVLYLVTSSQDERLGRPQRALVFRAGDKPNQAVVEFLRKDQVDLNGTVRLTSRLIKGCMGLISVENGELGS